NRAELDPAAERAARHQLHGARGADSERGGDQRARDLVQRRRGRRALDRSRGAARIAAAAAFGPSAVRAQPHHRFRAGRLNVVRRVKASPTRATAELNNTTTSKRSLMAREYANGPMRWTALLGACVAVF